MKKIEIASMFRRIVAAAMDAIVAFFVYFILVTYVATPIAQKASKYNDYVVDLYQYEVASHLYTLCQQDNTSKYVPIEVKDFSEKLDNNYLQKITETRSVSDYTASDFIRKLQYFYTVYLTGDVSKVELPNNTETRTYDAIKDKFVSPNYDKPIDGKLPSEIYTMRYFNVEIMGLPKEGEENKSPYYAYPIVDDHIDYEGTPVLKEGVSEYDPKDDLKNKLYTATSKLYYSDYIQELNKNIKIIQLWCYIPTFVFVMCFFYLLWPLVFKDGATLGKKTMSLAVIAKNGYSASKLQILSRQGIFILEVSFCSFVLGLGLTSVAMIGVGAVIMLVVALCNKNKCAPHDFAALTIVVDQKTSVYFDNVKQEDKAIKRVDENIENLHKYEPENVNIIQVGSKIVDPKIKQEVEENRKKEKQEK